MSKKALVILAGGKSSRMGRDKTFIKYKGSTFLLHLIRKAYGCFERVVISAGSEEHGRQIRQFLETHRKEPDMHGSAETRFPEIVIDGKGSGEHETDEILIPEIVIDGYEAIGPMGGLLSILEQTDLDAFAVTAVDMPLADMKVLHYLLERLDLVDASGKSFCELPASGKAGHEVNIIPEEGSKIPDSDSAGNAAAAPKEQDSHIKTNKAAVMLSFDGIHPEACAAAYSRRAYELFRPAYEAGDYSLFRALKRENVELLSWHGIPAFLHEPMNEEYLRKTFKNYNTSDDLEELK